MILRPPSKQEGNILLWALYQIFRWVFLLEQYHLQIVYHDKIQNAEVS